MVQVRFVNSTVKPQTNRIRMNRKNTFCPHCGSTIQLICYELEQSCERRMCSRCHSDLGEFVVDYRIKTPWPVR